MRFTKTWPLTKTQIGSLALAAIMVATLQACGAQTSQADTGVTQSVDVDTGELEGLMEQVIVDMDEYELDDAMIAYTQAVSKYSHLINDDTATQEDIDSAVDEIIRLRNEVINEDTIQYVPEEVMALPSYHEFLATIDGRIGQIYKVAGLVTTVNGGFRGADYMVYVYWDESETYGEVAAIRIPNDSYTESVHRYFEGDCMLESLDDNGHPQFVCTSYIAERS